MPPVREGSALAARTRTTNRRDGRSGELAPGRQARGTPAGRGARPTHRPRRRRTTDASIGSRQRGTRPQRRDAADDVPRGPLRIGRLGHRRALGTQGRRERLEVQAAAHRHDRDDQALVDAGQQGLEDAVGREAERGGGLFAVRRRRRIVVVRAQLEGRSGAGQSDGRGRAACLRRGSSCSVGAHRRPGQLDRGQRGQQPQQRSPRGAGSPVRGAAGSWCPAPRAAAACR